MLDPAAALGRASPLRMVLQCLDLFVAFLLGVLSAVCTRQPLTASLLARFRLPAWSSVRAWLLRLSAPMRRGAVADARLGLA